MRINKRSELVPWLILGLLVGIVFALCLGCATAKKCQCDCECTAEECHAVCSSEGMGEIAEPTGALVK